MILFVILVDLQHGFEKYANTEVSLVQHRLHRLSGSHSCTNLRASNQLPATNLQITGSAALKTIIRRGRKSSDNAILLEPSPRTAVFHQSQSMGQNPHHIGHMATESEGADFAPA